jgi:mannonate dehydratase
MKPSNVMSSLTASGSDVSRRRLLKRVMSAGAGVAGVGLMAPDLHAEPTQSQDTQTNIARATRGMPAPKIKDVTFIDAFSVVKVTTDQPGLYGYGEAAVPARAKLVKTAVLEYLKPLVIGRSVDRIEETWQFLFLSSYYKNDHVQNSAIAGICDALWDIKGRQAGMPIYQLIGGKCRDAAEVYMHVRVPKFEPALIAEAALQLYTERKARNIQIDMFHRDAPIATLDGGMGFDRDVAVHNTMKAFEAFRAKLPATVRLGVDVHSELDPGRALQFAKDAEQFKPWYWVEDIVPTEHHEYFSVIRHQSAVPLSLGELWNNPTEWRPVIEGRLINYFRNHMAHMGGFTPGRRLAAYAENFEVKTGWHAAGCSPIGQMARLTLDVTCPNFGIHEDWPISDRERQVFQGIHEVRDGFAWVSEKPGWGIEIDEAAAAKMPLPTEGDRKQRLRDGSYLPGI